MAWFGIIAVNQNGEIVTFEVRAFSKSAARARALNINPDLEDIAVFEANYIK